MKRAATTEPGILNRRDAIGFIIAAGFAPSRALSQASSTAPLEKVAWGFTNAGAYYWDVYAAIDLGFMREERIEIDSINVPNVSQSMQLLLASALDILSVSTEVAISAIEHDADIVMIGVETTKPTFALVARPEIKSYDDLRGKTLGVTQMTEASTTMLKLLLQKHGVKSGEYDLIPAGGTPNRYAALTKGAISATMLSQPMDFVAAGEGMRLLGYALEAFDGPLVSIAVRKAWAKSHSDLTTRFLRATARAARWLHDKANREAAIDLLSKATKSPRAESVKSYDLFFGPLDVMSVDLTPTLDGIQKYIDLRGTGGPPERYIDASYLNRALGR